MPGSHATAPAGPRCKGSDARHAPAGCRREPADRGADARGTPPRQIAIGMLNDVRSGPLRAEHVDHAGERIGAHPLAHQRRQPLRSLAEVDRLRRHHDPDVPGRSDHECRLQRANHRLDGPRLGVRPDPHFDPGDLEFDPVGLGSATRPARRYGRRRRFRLASSPAPPARTSSATPTRIAAPAGARRTAAEASARDAARRHKPSRSAS